jgi:shikimate kinase
MEGYYDPHPRFFLERTLVLVGYPGSDVAQICHDLAARTGLPHTEVERWCEADAGMGRGRIAWSEGRSGLWRREARALSRALSRRPHGFVSTGTGCLLDPSVRNDCLQRGCVVFVRRPPEALLQRVGHRVLQAPGGIPEYPDGAPASIDDLEKQLAEHAAVEVDAHVLLEAGNRHPTRLSQEILGSLDRIAGTVTSTT